MKLGTLNLENNLILSPLLNVTTGPYRRFCKKFNKIGLVCVPMFYSKRITNEPKSVVHELYKIEEERPISVQLIGSDTEALKKAIEFLENYKFDVLDINAGCPSRRAIKASQGGYLLKDLRKLEELLNTALKYSSRPVSLKTRLGYENTIKINELARIVNNSGIEFLTVHARTVKNRFDNSLLDLETLKKLKKIAEIPLIGNGDINNPNFAKLFLDYTKVDGLMIGRGSMGNPKIFSQIYEYITNDKETLFKNNIDLMKKFIKIYEQTLDDFLDGISFNYPRNEYKFIELKRNSIWLTKNIDNSTDIRRELSRAKNLKQLRILLQRIFKK